MAMIVNSNSMMKTNKHIAERIYGNADKTISRHTVFNSIKKVGILNQKVEQSMTTYI